MRGFECYMSLSSKRINHEQENLHPFYCFQFLAGGSKLDLSCCKKRQKSPNQETGFGKRGSLEALKTKLILNDKRGQLWFLRSIWYHSEPSDVSYHRGTLMENNSNLKSLFFMFCVPKGQELDTFICKKKQKKTVFLTPLRPRRGGGGIHLDLKKVYISMILN